LVYGAIVFLLYFVLLLLSKVESNKHSITKTIRELTIMSSEKYTYKGDIVFLVRVYNEAPVLEETLNSIFNGGYKNIVIVDDGSSDDSWSIIQKISKKHSHIIALKHSQNRGG
jgi:cellulose synthase/poly-beta-1,6-N-acetylglucosamine synthase-like glycosyltransferase